MQEVRTVGGDRFYGIAFALKNEAEKPFCELPPRFVFTMTAPLLNRCD